MDDSTEYEKKKKMFELLSKLADLRDSNVLTEEEFNNLNKQILNAQYESKAESKVSIIEKSQEKTSVFRKNNVASEKVVEKKEKHKSAAKLFSILSLILTFLTIVTFIVGTVFLCTARIDVHYEQYENGTSHWITDNYIAAAFDGWDVSILCIFTIIDTILMLVVLFVKLKSEIKHNKDDNRTIITDILTLLVSSIPVVFSALTVDYYANVGLLLFLIISASSSILIGIHLILLLIKKLVKD